MHYQEYWARKIASLTQEILIKKRVGWHEPLARGSATFGYIKCKTSVIIERFRIQRFNLGLKNAIFTATQSRNTSHSRIRRAWQAGLPNLFPDVVMLDSAFAQLLILCKWRHKDENAASKLQERSLHLSRTDWPPWEQLHTVKLSTRQRPSRGKQLLRGGNHGIEIRFFVFLQVEATQLTLGGFQSSSFVFIVRLPWLGNWTLA